jgi:hypothetical protein
MFEFGGRSQALLRETNEVRKGSLAREGGRGVANAGHATVAVYCELDRETW